MYKAEFSPRALSEEHEAVVQPAAQSPQPRISDESSMSPVPASHPRVFAVTGGKGGVGKTSIALNLGLVLARQGKKVLLLDGDTDLANVNIMLGRYPQYTLEHVVSGERSLREVVLAVNHGLHIIPGASGVQRCIRMSRHDRYRLLETLARMERQYDYVIIDTAAGLQAPVLHMIAAAAMACVVVTPDPTSLTDAFSLLKLMRRRGYRRDPGIVVNMARGSSQAQAVFRRFSAAVQRYIGFQPHYLGAIWRDETIAQSIATQRPVALLDESDPSCRQFWTLADMVEVRCSQLDAKAGGFAAYWQRLAKRMQDKSAPAPVPKPEETAMAGDTRSHAAAPLPASSQSAQQQAERLWQEWGQQLQFLMNNPESTALQRYQGLTLCLELLGENMDEDTIEILQTGLASMDWESLSVSQRAHFSAHLRQLADRVEPPLFERPADRSADTKPRPIKNEKGSPSYDESAFGSQEALLSQLRQQPAGTSISSLLEALGRPHDESLERVFRSPAMILRREPPAGDR